MFDRLWQVSAAPRDVMALLSAAEKEARLLGAPACEAEHILLALVDGPNVAASTVLSSLGLSRERIAEGLERELANALARVHVHLVELPHPLPRRDSGRMRWGESAQRAAERSIREAPEDPGLRMLLAVVHAESGVIPRLLAELGVSVANIETAVDQADRE